MIGVRVVALASLGFVLGAHSLVAQTPLAYRGYALGSSIASVVKVSGVRDDETKTLHGRPATIQEVVWRAPYVSSNSELADPVRDVRFTFCDDKLYQILVTYDRDRTEGLTDDDVIESLSKTYGRPLLSATGTAPEPARGGVSSRPAIVARWEDASVLITLAQDAYPPQYQLVLILKALNESALTAIAESARLDTQEAPQRELDRLEKKTLDARMASEKARAVNKAAFRP